jgi:hypothetical protein
LTEKKKFWSDAKECKNEHFLYEISFCNTIICIKFVDLSFFSNENQQNKYPVGYC